MFTANFVHVYRKKECFVFLLQCTYMPVLYSISYHTTILKKQLWYWWSKSVGLKPPPNIVPDIEVFDLYIEVFDLDIEVFYFYIDVLTLVSELVKSLGMEPPLNIVPGPKSKFFALISKLWLWHQGLGSLIFKNLPTMTNCLTAARKAQRWSAPSSSQPAAAPPPAQAGCRTAARRAQRWKWSAPASSAPAATFLASHSCRYCYLLFWP